MPFVSPPVRMRAAAGPTVLAQPAAIDADEKAAAVQWSVGLHPFQLSRPLSEQPYDLGFGYLIERVGTRDDEVLYHGGELELGYYPWRFSAGGERARAGAFATVETMVPQADPTADPGYGGSFGLAIELTGYHEGPFSTTNEDGGGAVGYSAGQWAVGLYGAGAMREVAGERYFMTTFGMSGRIPFLAGVAYGLPASDDDKSAITYTPASSKRRGSRRPASVQSRPNRRPAHVSPRK